MIYDTIEIRYDRLAKKKPSFYIYREADHRNIDRVASKNGKYTHHPLGFFRFPRRWGWKRAFESLKAGMIKDREDVIRSMTAEIEALKLLELPK